MRWPVIHSLILSVSLAASAGCAHKSKTPSVGTKTGASGGSVASQLKPGMSNQQVEDLLGPAPAGSVSVERCGEASGQPWVCRKEKRQDCELFYQEQETKPGHKEWVLKTWDCR